MRGGSRLIKVMINEKPVSFRIDTQNFIGPELLPIEAVERIEVIRGPGSALYGANAFLGVINIVTRSGAAIHGAEVSLGFSLFNGNLGYDVGMVAGKKSGPFDIMLALQLGRTNRSGLSIPCTTMPAGDCAAQRRQAADPTIFDRRSFDDLARPLSLLSTLETDLAELFHLDNLNLGQTLVQVNYQVNDSRGSFSDWSVLQYDTATNVKGNIVEPIKNSGNRIALYNTTVHLQHDLSLADGHHGSLSLLLSRGGILDGERLRDAQGFPQRSRYGSWSYDLSGELHLKLLENRLRLRQGWLKGQPLINHLLLLLAADYATDNVTYAENRFAVPIRYRISSLWNVGVLGQLMASLLNQRLNLTSGLRYDINHGAKLSPVQLAKVENPDDNLCDGFVCYASLNYRLGLTYSMLRNVGALSGEGYLLDNLYLKALYGTAFKAPSPSLLYHDDTLGATPVNPNPGLKPQTIRSLELMLGLSMFNHFLEGTAVFFRNQLADQAGFQWNVGGVMADNMNRVDSLGVEGGLKLQGNYFSLKGAVAYQHSKKVFDHFSVRRIPETFGYPDISGHLNLSLDLKWLYCLLDVGLSYVGVRVGHPMNVKGADDLAHKYILDGYTLINLNLLSYDFVLLEDIKTNLTFSILNLMNTRYAYPGFQPHYGIDLPGEPRVFYWGIRQTF
jgi:iron complex outermembrane receptor protein